MTGPRNAAQQARLRFIDFLLDRFGMVNRTDITDYYGLSEPQASLDLRAYNEQAPANMQFDKTDRCYRRSATFTRRFP
jgi:uncharacterized protein YcaQ